MPSLTILLLIPFAGAIVASLPLGRRPAVPRAIALIASGAALLFAWSLWFRFDGSQAGMQFLEKTAWHPRLGSYYAVGVDGFSFPMVLLATLLNFVALLASYGIKEKVKSYYVSMLLLESAMLGVFVAQDWSLFYVFWELTLIPLFFLINRWGGERRDHAALNFVLYTMGGSVFMLISLLLAFDAAGVHSFAMIEMSAGLRNLPAEAQVLIFLGFLIGFGVKMPIFPIHGWLPLAHVEAPSPVSILLSGVLLKMGSYGLIRAAGTLPGAVMLLQDALAALALVSMLYGAVLAWRQSDLKMMIAYSSISHMGVVLLGIAALNVAGLTGAVMQMVAHGLVAGSLFLLIGLLYQRTHTREIGQYSSLVRVAPRFAFFTSLAFVAAVGMPGTAGFVAELHAIVGGFQAWGWVVVLLGVAMMIGAAYSVRTVGRLFTGPVRPGMEGVEDLRRMEMAAAGLLAGGVVALGVLPAPALDLMAGSVAHLGAAFAQRP
ncbi:MAG: NADH-quinone oxidoreductase subunit M [Alphaproteobacteria bacterium]|nr:NADH-quinone oxidoreductase subunit M [Alphaproteobacteria bacterium]